LVPANLEEEEEEAIGVGPCCQNGRSEELEAKREVSLSKELEEERGRW
jgi:hypothetical protein